MKKQTGLALLLVLWVLSLLSIIAASFSLNIKRETAIVSALKQTAEANALAESGIQLAQLMLLNPDDNKRWRVDGSIYQINTDNTNIKLRIRLLSEAGKINLNIADLTVLQQLFSRSPSGTEAQFSFAKVNRAAAILDWRDSDEFIRINGAEQQQYKDAGLNYLPSNQNIQSLSELNMILGIDDTLLKWIEPLITIYGQQADVDLQVASKEVLQVLLPTPELAQQYVQLRTENAKRDLPAPPAPNNLSRPSILDAVTVIAEAHYHDSVAVIYAVLKKNIQNNSTFQVLSWQRYQQHHHSLFADDMNQLLVKSYVEPELNH